MSWPTQRQPRFGRGADMSSDAIAMLALVAAAASAYRVAEEALETFDDTPTRLGWNESHKQEDRVPLHMALVEARAKLDAVLMELDGDTQHWLARYRNSAAFDSGTTAYRQSQPLADNPYAKGTERGEWDAWVDGWQLVRNVTEKLQHKVSMLKTVAKKHMRAHRIIMAEYKPEIEAAALRDMGAMEYATFSVERWRELESEVHTLRERVAV